jgi:outer membrane protein insertion porin family
MSMKSIGLALTVALVLTLCLPEASSARRRPGGPVIEAVRVLGTRQVSEKQIRSLMRTKESKFLRTRRYRESTLEADVKSIESFYRRNGFLEASVSYNVTFDQDREQAWIEVSVTEGDQTRIEAVVFEGNTQLPEASLRKVVVVKAGQPLDERKVAEDKYRIYTVYADKGFVFADIDHRIEIEGGAATITYVVSEGGPTKIGRIDIRDNNRVNERIIRRELTLRPGDIFSRKKLLDSQQHLYDTGFFKDVEIEPSAAGATEGSVNLLVKVKERKMGEVSFAVGYGTREETRLTVGWLQRNLWNSGRQIEIRSIIASENYEDGLTRLRGDIALTDRWLLGRRLVGGIALFGQETLEDYNEIEGGRYTLVRLGGDLSVKKEISRSTRLTFAYTHEFVDVREPNWGAEDTEDLRITLGQEVNRSATVLMERDTRLPFFDPHRGSLTRLVTRTSGGIFGGDNSYNKMTWSWSRYFQFHRKSVIAISTRAGWAEAFGESRTKGVPEYERFYAGGSSSIRGYNEQEFGPGDFLFLANLEIRYPLVWRLVGVTFLDMGNVWDSIDDVTRSDFDVSVSASEFAARRNADVKYTVGLGLGIQTPVGPARVDYGVRLKRAISESGSKESPGMIHITVGHAF